MPDQTNNGFFSKLLAFFKGNPIFTALAGMFMLAIILPPRKRKRKRYTTYSRRRKNPGNPGQTKNPGKRKKAKKAKKVKKPSVSSRKTKRQSSGLPDFMVKGSKAAKDHMAHLRSLRKK
jgi:hypothetical protein